MSLNKFYIIKAEMSKNPDYNGPCVVMACAADNGFYLFFPINEESASIINYVLDDENKEKYDINTNILGIYKTMIDSWDASNRYLSGVLMDTYWDDEAEEDSLSISLAVSDNHGEIDGLVPVNFLHAVVLASMEKVAFIIDDKLITKMMPKEESQEYSDQNVSFPEDKKIMNIAKTIMSGKTRNK